MPNKKTKSQRLTAKEKKALRDFKAGKPQVMTREDMANSQLGKILGMKKRNEGGVQQRKQRKLIEQDKERKKIPTRIEDTFRRNGDIGASPAERREKKQERIKEDRRKQVKKMRESLPQKDIVAQSKKNGKPKKMKRPAPDVGVVLGGPFKSELQRGIERVKQIKKQQAKDDAAFKKKVEESKKNRGKPIGSGIYGKGPLGKNFIGKKMNMGGVMKNRGGTFKGVF